MNELTLIRNAAQDLSLFDGVEDTLTKTLAGDAFSGRRISIRGGRFRQVINGEEVNVSKEDTLDVVIVGASPRFRSYYKDKYVEGQDAAPVCWSRDQQVPAEDVPEGQRQHNRCSDCPQNIKGSGEGDRRACRFGQKLGIVMDGAIEDGEVYQLQVPAMSLFGDEGGKLGLQSYANMLQSNKLRVLQVVTRLTMDLSSTAPKLTFSPVRALDNVELKQCIELSQGADAAKAIEVSFPKPKATEAAAPAPAPAPAPVPKASKPAPAPEPEVIPAEQPAPKKRNPFAKAKEEVEDVPEPKVMASSKQKETVTSTSLEGILGEWASDDD